MDFVSDNLAKWHNNGRRGKGKLQVLRCCLLLPLQQQALAVAAGLLRKYLNSCLTWSLPKGASFPCLSLYCFPTSSKETTKLSAYPFFFNMNFLSLCAGVHVFKTYVYIIWVTQLLVSAALPVQQNQWSSCVSYPSLTATISCSCCKSSLGLLNLQCYFPFALDIIQWCSTEGAKRSGQE